MVFHEVCHSGNGKAGKYLAAKVTAVVDKRGEQLLTRYGGRNVVSTEYVARECPSDLRHTIKPAIEFSPPTAHGVVPTDFYKYSYDRSLEVKMELHGSRLVKRRQKAQVLHLS